jgi:1,4-dihydroxy-2-naphthoate octaprenyltransferase
MTTATRPSPVAVWVQALRPKTLGASLCPVLMGAALAWNAGAFEWVPVLAAFAGACLLQIASNFANDLFDGLHGTDSGVRLGPARAVGSGWVTPRAMAVALLLVLAVAVVPAIYLVGRGGSVYAWIAVAGALSAVGYTAPPLRIGYRGLGDLFVFVFFGPIAVAGTAAACDGRWPKEAFVAGIAPGAIGMALLATNNLRDRVGDAASGKRTLVVRFGERFGRAQIVACHAAAAVVPALLWWRYGLPSGVMLASALSLAFAPASVAVLRGRDGADLNRTLAAFGIQLYLYGAAFALGMWLGGGAGHP